jgi:hypothetical protein
MLVDEREQLAFDWSRTLRTAAVKSGRSSALLATAKLICSIVDFI